MGMMTVVCEAIANWCSAHHPIKSIFMMLDMVDNQEHDLFIKFWDGFGEASERIRTHHIVGHRVQDQVGTGGEDQGG